ELFLAGTEPTETCDLHQRIALDRATGLRATADTPPERVVERVYTVLPPEAADWARENGLPQPPPPAAPDRQVAAVGEEGVLAGSAAADPALARAARGGPLVMAAPDEGAVYRLDPALPRTAQRIAVSARAGAGAILRRVTLYVDGRALAHFDAAPYEVLWPLEPGVHTFWAEATGADGERIESDRVRIEVQE
ncbi:MAG: hypothetical protein ACK2UY_09335, partial [Anaerolineae bacterium]